MKKTITKRLAGIGVATLAAATLFAGKVMAFSFAGGVQGGAEAARGDGQPSELFGDAGVFTQITNTVLFIVGILSVIMLIYGGLRYVISGGDQKKVTDAKNTIMYAVIGLIIAILSFAIINFVIGAFATDNSFGGTNI